jgi:transcription initiation factor TFIIB
MMKPSVISCSECQMDHLVADPSSGELVCNICGLVVQEKMEEDRKFQFDSGNSNPMKAEYSSLASFHMGLSTNMGKTNRDARGQILEPSIHSSIRRLRDWDYRIRLQDSKDINMKRAFSLLYTLSSKLNLSDATIEKAAYIYRKALVNQMTRGRSIEPLITAAVYIAMRESLSSRSLKEIAYISNIRLKTLAKTVRLLASELDILIPAADLYRCVTKVGNTAGLSEKTKREACKLISNLKSTEYSAGKKPLGLAATLLYVSSTNNEEHISQREIAKAAEITQVTIRSRLRDLRAKNLV